jgi:hypothetical protein
MRKTSPIERIFLLFFYNYFVGFYLRSKRRASKTDAPKRRTPAALMMQTQSHGTSESPESAIEPEVCNAEKIAITSYTAAANRNIPPESTIPKESAEDFLTLATRRGETDEKSIASEI